MCVDYDSWKLQSPPESEYTVTFTCIFCGYKGQSDLEFCNNSHNECACLNCRKEILDYEKEHNLPLTFAT